MRKVKSKQKASKTTRRHDALKASRKNAAHWKRRYDALNELFDTKLFKKYQCMSDQIKLVEGLMRDAPLYWQLKVENQRLVAKINELMRLPQE